MADRMIDPTNNDPQGEITDELKAVVQAVLNEAVSKMEAGEEISPSRVWQSKKICSSKNASGRRRGNLFHACAS